ncbi:MAG: hypothetical protein JNG84_12090 [Archangium sp.]|nr:hypothetical protein [Archangium sp.]
MTEWPSLSDGAFADVVRRWLEVALRLPAWAGGLGVLAGVLLLWRGNGRLVFRIVAAPLGLACAPWVAVVAPHLGITEVPPQVNIGAAAVLAVLGLVFPPGVVFFAVGAPCGVLAGALAGETDWLLGFLPGFIMGGALGLVAHRVVAAVLTSLLGGALLVLGAAVGLLPWLPPLARIVDAPLLVAAIAACFAAAGVVYQLFVHPPPDVEDEQRRAKATRKKEAKAQRAREKRWAASKSDSEAADP